MKHDGVVGTDVSLGTLGHTFGHFKGAVTGSVISSGDSCDTCDMGSTAGDTIFDGSHGGGGYDPTWMTYYQYNKVCKYYVRLGTNRAVTGTSVGDTSR